MSRRLALVTGASGFVGRHLCRELHGRGWQVRAAVRGPSADLVADEAVQVGDIGATTQWKDALTDVAVVFHLAARVHVLRETSADAERAFAAVNVRGTERLALETARQGACLVYMSSIGVLGDRTTGRPFAEHDPLDPQTPYARSKAEAEQRLTRSHPDHAVTIVRAPLVYGPHAPGNFARLLWLVKRGVPLPLGAVRNARSLVFVENLVSLLLRSAEPTSSGVRVVHAADAEVFSTQELIRHLAEVLGVPARLIPVPVGVLRTAGRLAGRLRAVEQLTESLEVSTEATRVLLGWSPPVGAHVGLARSAREPDFTP